MRPEDTVGTHNCNSVSCNTHILSVLTSLLSTCIKYAPVAIQLNALLTIDHMSLTSILMKHSICSMYYICLNDAILPNHTLSDNLATVIALTRRSVPVQIAIAAELSIDHKRLPS